MLFYVFLTLKFDSKAHFTCEYIYEENYVKPQHTAKESFREFKSFLSLFHVNFFPFSNNIACRVNRECVAKKITKKNIHRQKYICCLMGWLKQQQKKMEIFLTSLSQRLENSVSLLFILPSPSSFDEKKTKTMSNSCLVLLIHCIDTQLNSTSTQT